MIAEILFGDVPGPPPPDISDIPKPTSDPDPGSDETRFASDDEDTQTDSGSDDSAGDDPDNSGENEPPDTDDYGADSKP